MKTPALAVLAALIATAGCSPTDDQSNRAEESQGLLGSMQWFGYFSSASDTVNYTDEVKDHSNFVFVAIKDADTTHDWLTRVQHAQENGLRVVLDVHDVFFYFTDTKPPIPKLYAPAVYQARWNAVVSTLGSYQSTILAFYPHDEPCLWGVNTNDLYVVAQQIKATAGFQNTPVMMVEAYDHLSPPNSCDLPANFDWFGFDCYVGWDHCDGASIPSYYNTLKSRVLSSTSGAKKLVIVPAAVTRTTTTNPPTVVTTPADLVTWLGNYVSLVQGDGMTIAMMPYLWQDVVNPGFVEYGDRDVANAAVQEAFKLQAGRITGKFPNPITGPFKRGLSGPFFYSNGQFPDGPHPAYCGYWNETQLIDCTGKTQNLIPPYAGLPSLMTNDGLCSCANVSKPQPGNYKLAGDSASLLYASSTAWCTYSSMTSFEQCTDLCSSSSLATTKPWGLAYHGTCSPCSRVYPAGVFKTCDGGYYYSNGGSAYCQCPNTPAAFRQFGTVPAGQANAGVCANKC